MNTIKHCALVLIFMVIEPHFAQAQKGKTLDQIPDLKTLPDRTVELQQIIDQNAGNLRLEDAKNLRSPNRWFLI